MFRITPPKDNAVSATYQLLKSLGAKVTQKTVEDTLKNHPDYPSLLATSDALNEWNIENVSVKIEFDQIYDLPSPFLAHLSTSESDTFVLVKSINNNIVEWVDTKKGLKRTKLSVFLHKWSGIA